MPPTQLVPEPTLLSPVALFLTLRYYAACTAYTRFLLDIGHSQDLLALQVALAPCTLGYGAVAKMLFSHPDTKKEGNTYWPWIENYVAEDYVEAVRLASGEFLLRQP